MPLVKAKCTNCGANLEVENSKDAAICPYCQTAYIVEKAINSYTITNSINAEQVNIYYSENDGDRINREFDKIDGFIKIEDYESAKISLDDLTNTYPGKYEVWEKYLDFLYICINKRYSVGQPLVKTITCLKKLCQENQKEELQSKLNTKFDEICKRIENGDLSIISLCGTVEFKKDIGLFNELFNSDYLARQRWNDILSQLKVEGNAFSKLINHSEQILDMIKKLNVGFDSKSKLFCPISASSDEILFVIGYDLIVLHKNNREVYLYSYKLSKTASPSENFYSYIKASKKMYQSKSDLHKVEEQIEKTKKDIDYYSDSSHTVSLIDAMINNKEKSKLKKEMSELVEKRNVLINSISDLESILN